MTSTVLSRQWVSVCAYNELLPERGAAALIGDVQIALVRTYDGEVYAVGNRDPFSGAYVLSRGIVGTHGDAPTLASPVFKQVFDLRTGICLTETDVHIPTYRASRDGDLVMVAVGETA